MSLNAVGMEQGPQPSGLSSITGGIKDAFPAMLDLVTRVMNSLHELESRLDDIRCLKVPSFTTMLLLSIQALSSVLPLTSFWTASLAKMSGGRPLNKCHIKSQNIFPETLKCLNVP